jgi:hypothetical protein
MLKQRDCRGIALAYPAVRKRHGENAAAMAYCGLKLLAGLSLDTRITTARPRRDLISSIIERIASLQNQIAAIPHSLWGNATAADHVCFAVQPGENRPFVMSATIPMLRRQLQIPTVFWCSPSIKYPPASHVSASVIPFSERYSTRCDAITFGCRAFNVNVS